MQIFLSHATADREITSRIQRQLGDLGVSVYLAEHDQQAGRLLSDKVKASLFESHLVVALLTPAGFDSRYVHQEIGAAAAAGRIVIPLVDTSVQSEDLGMLNGLEYIVLDQEKPLLAMNLLTERVVALAQAQQDRLDLLAMSAAMEAEDARRQAERERLYAVLAVSIVLAAGAYLYYNVD
jgi:hypothetical protein